MEGKIEEIQSRIAELTTKCSLAAKESELLKKILADKDQEVTKGMEELEALYDFLREQNAEDFEELPPELPEKPKAKRGHPKMDPADRKKMSKEKKAEYDRMRYRERKGKARKVGRPSKEQKEKEAEEEAMANIVVKSIDEINEEAKAAGMSYGKFVAQEQIKRQSLEMRLARERRHRRVAENESTEQREGISEQG